MDKTKERIYANLLLDAETVKALDELVEKRDWTRTRAIVNLIKAGLKVLK